MEETMIKELFLKPDYEFYHHITDPLNTRILFSGKFGIGKTTFINHFFNEKVTSFVKIHLYPVNYSIASNEDIIDLIKYDILMELIRKGATFTSENISQVDSIVGFTHANAFEIFKAVIGCFPKLRKNVKPAIKEMEDLYKSFKKYCDMIACDEGEKTYDFAKQIQNMHGSIYEQTVITHTINDKIEQLRMQAPKREVILVIDDLDRIDPEHIFRLFNVFAAHFDSSNSNSTSNKFGFDKVMFVCDVNNIRSIFKHRYGADTDFGGYVDKFFSKEVFEFDNV